MKGIDIDHSGAVDYKEFVKAFKVKDKSAEHIKGVPHTWQESVLQQVANVLFQHRIHLRSAFRMFDMDNRFVLFRCLC